MKTAMARQAFVAALAIAIVTMLACAARAQDEDDSASEAGASAAIVQFGGRWLGTDTIEKSGSGDCTNCPMELDLGQTRKKVTGQFAITTGNGNRTGSVSGKVTRNGVSMTFHAAAAGGQRKCKLLAVASVDGTTMTGSFVAIGNRKRCKGRGSFNLTRQ